MIRLTDVELDRLRNRVEGLFSGAYMGDVIGFPWEQMTQEKILKETDGRGVEGTHTPFKPRYLDPQWGNRLEYRSSDDTDLTWAVGIALERTKMERISFIDAQAQEHVFAMEKGVPGWGPTLLAGLRPLQAWSRTAGFGGRSPRVPVIPNDLNQSGTGPLMKASPMAMPALFAQLGDPNRFPYVAREVLRDLHALGRMTHAGDAVLVTIPYVLLLAQFLNPHRADGERRVDFNALDRWRSLLVRSGEPRGDRIFADTAELYRVIELCDVTFSAFYVRHPELCTGRMDGLRSQPAGWTSVADTDALLAANAFKPSEIGLINAQYALAQAVTVRSFTHSLPEPVLEVVNRGGDTDTHGCITGALAGAYHGRSEGDLPTWWKTHDRPALEFAHRMFTGYVLSMLNSP